MAALHEALKSLAPTDYSDVPFSSADDLKDFLAETFSNGHLIVDSVPIPAPSDDSITLEGRERVGSTASNASEILISSARSSPPPPDVEALQKEWKPVKMNPKENPLGMSVYKLGGKDGKGSWFARRSVHEGLGFAKWKKGLEREFPETMKVQGGPGEGNIRGIGGEKRVGYKNVEGVGKMEVYHLSAQFPGPTTPRDFVTLLITSDQALKPQSENEEEVPRHYMVISKPCIHLDAPPREGFIRGQYESVEFIREIPLKKPPRKSASASNLLNGGRATLGKEAVLRNAARNHPAPLSEEGIPKAASSSDVNLLRSDSSRSRGKTISFAESRGRGAKGENMDNPLEDDECEQNPIEWIMVTRSDPGGSVPRFMIERGTPGGIVSDASKFLDWACSIDIEDLEIDDGESSVGDEEKRVNGHAHERNLHDYQTNGHLAGLDGTSDITATPYSAGPAATAGGGIYDKVTGTMAAGGAMIAAYTPEIISSHLPGGFPDSSTIIENGTSTPSRRESMSSIASTSSIGTFISALTHGPISHDDAASIEVETDSIEAETDSLSRSRASSQQEKELQKLEDKKRKLDERLSKAREREESKKNDETMREGETMKKAEEKHKNDIARLEAKKEKEMAKLEAKRRKEEKKANDRKRKLMEKDEKVRMTRELEEARAELSLLRKEKDILRGQVGDLQAENTAMAAKLGRLGAPGESVLKEVRQEAEKHGRLRATSLKGMGRTNSSRSVTNLGSGSWEK